MQNIWSLAVVFLLLRVLSSIACGQIADPIPDIPRGSIIVRPKLFAAGFTPEQVQENPVGFTQRVGPTDLVSIADGSGNLIVANYGGRFSLLDALGHESSTPFLDLSDPASVSYSPNFEIGQAHGVTSIAFHPGFADPTSAGFKKFYTLESETASSGVPDFGGTQFPSVRGGSHHDEVLYEYTLGNVTDTSCDAGCGKREVLRVLQPGWHHNLGDLVFDADEMLFVSSGDGSTSVTPAPFMSDNSVMLTNIFGKVLRIDPLGDDSANGNYGLPANPFADGPGGNVDEIYAYGLRNPYRLAFDSATGDLYASETGEISIESVNRIVAGGNHGWNLKEGSFLYDPLTKLIAVDIDSDFDGVGDVAQANGLIEPMFEYDRDDGRAIIGGVLYRGAMIPELQGHYVFADFDGRLFYGDPATGAEYEFQLAPGDLLPSNIHSVNSDANGELYVLGIRDLGHGEYDGWVVSLLPEPSAPQVTQLLVGSSNWSQGFADVLGSTAGFYAVPTDDDQLKSVPWSIDEVRIVFSDDVSIAQDDLQVIGSGPEPINVRTMEYAPATHTATWTIDRVTADKLLLVLSDDVTSISSGLALDGEYTTESGPMPTGDGTPGGDFHFRFNVLTGDADGNGVNSLNDLQTLASNWQQPTDASNMFGDFDGSGQTTLNDLQILATHWGRSLPLRDPTIPPVSAAVPEPSSWLFLVVGMLLVASRSRTSNP